MLLPFLQGCSLFGGPKLLWRAPIASSTTPILQNGQLYVQGFRAGHPGEPARVYALDPATGKENWVSQDSVTEIYGESGGYLFFRNKADHLVQLDARTGDQLYVSGDSTPVITKWLLHGDVMFIINAAMEVVAVDNRLNKVLWRMALPQMANNNLTLELAGQKVIVSGLVEQGENMYGMIWALDPATGAEIWSFEPPLSHDFAPLEVVVHEPYLLATNTSPLTLHTHVLHVQTGKELYPPIGAFDFYGCQGDTAYAPSGTFDLKTGQRLGNGEGWVANHIVHNGIGWRLDLGTNGVLKAFFLRTDYDGDVRGNRSWYNTPANSSFKGYDLLTGKEKYHTKEYTYTQFSEPIEADGIMYHTSMAMMKEGESGVWAYRLP